MHRIVSGYNKEDALKARMRMGTGFYLLGAILASILATVSSFLPSCSSTSPAAQLVRPCWGVVQRSSLLLQHKETTTTQLHLFDKMFEEEGVLGKGITVGKIQVALISEDRAEDSIFGLLEQNARWIANDDEPGSLADLAHEVCLSLLRKKDSWTAACSASQWFSADDYGKAEAQFNDWANSEAAKFEKEYIPDIDSDATEGGSTIVVVSVVIEIEGDTTDFEGAGFSQSGTEKVLNSIASNCMVDDGEVTNAVEVFWTPGDPKETLTSRDCIVDFPELIDL